MSDAQDRAEQFDEDILGGDPADPDATVLSDDTIVDFPPDRPLGIQHADADVTDESVEERLDQEQPEIWETAPEVDLPAQDG